MSIFSLIESFEKKQVPCAASEIYLKADDSIYDTEKLMPLIEELVHNGKLKKADAKVEVKQLNRGVRMERIPYGKHTKGGV